MHQSATKIAVLSLLAFAMHVEAFGVYVDYFTLHTTKEFGGIPEIYIVCNIRTTREIVRGLPFANVVNKRYYTSPKEESSILDRDLEPTEQHHCEVYEHDGAEHDFDAEDFRDDYLGSFTIFGSEFLHRSRTQRRVPGGFSIGLVKCIVC